NDLDMMYQAAYVPDFYRALHALVHAEFRARRSGDELRRAATHPLDWRARHARLALQLVRRRAEMPLLPPRVDRLAPIPPARPTAVPVALLSPEAAAVPTAQPVVIERASLRRRDAVVK